MRDSAPLGFESVGDLYLKPYKSLDFSLLMPLFYRLKTIVEAYGKELEKETMKRGMRHFESYFLSDLFLTFYLRDFATDFSSCRPLLSECVFV